MEKNFHELRGIVETEFKHLALDLKDAKESRRLIHVRLDDMKDRQDKADFRIKALAVLVFFIASKVGIDVAGFLKAFLGGG